jgi:hypothetical protein
MTMNNTHGAFIVSWDFTHGNDKAILLVGSQANGTMDIVNAFQGQETIDIYEKLSKKKESKND